jgi:tetratricopeptide (TPR) repeat protein
MRHSYYHQLPLAPLREAEVAELLGGLLGVDLSLAPVLGFVQERTGGNPFFVEELTRTLVEDGTLAGAPGTYRLTRLLADVRVPPSVQAVLAARIDRLPPDQKDVLQTAAVIGRTFSADVLARAVDRDPESLEEALRAHCAAALLQEIGGHPAADYRFWHPLTQEVAYSSLLSSHRARRHLRVAHAIVAADANHLDERAALVATHFDRAGEHMDAARWNARAATWILRHDMPEAVSRWRSVLRSLDAAAAAGTVPEDEQAERLALGIRARHRLIQFGARLGNPVEDAELLFGEGKAMAERLDDVAGLGNLTQVIANVYFWLGRFEESRSRFLDAAEISQRSNDDGLRASLWSGPTLVYPYTGPLAEGLDIAERSLALSAGSPDRGSEHLGYSPMMRTLLYRAEMLSLVGRLDEARQDADRARSIARERSVTEFLVWTFAILPRLAQLTGSSEDLREEARAALAVAEESGNSSARVVALLGLGTAELVTGRWQEASLALERGLAEAAEGRAHFDEARLLTRIAMACCGAGAVTEAVHAAERAVSVARVQGARVLECGALLTQAQASRSAEGRRADADGALQRALALAEVTGATTYVPFIREEHGRLHDDQAALRDAARLYAAVGASGHARRLADELRTANATSMNPGR